MLFAGGICFILIGLLNEVFPWNMALLSQMVISARNYRSCRISGWSNRKCMAKVKCLGLFQYAL